MLLSSSRPKHSVETSTRFSDLKAGIRELSFPFKQEPTEKQPLQMDRRKIQSTCTQSQDWPWVSTWWVDHSQSHWLIRSGWLSDWWSYGPHPLRTQQLLSRHRCQGRGSRGSQGTEWRYSCTWLEIRDVMTPVVTYDHATQNSVIVVSNSPERPWAMHVQTGIPGVPSDFSECTGMKLLLQRREAGLYPYHCLHVPGPHEHGEAQI